MTQPGTASADRPDLSRRRIAGYAAGSAGTGLLTTVPRLILLFSLTDVLGAAAGLAASSWSHRSCGTWSST